MAVWIVTETKDGDRQIVYHYNDRSRPPFTCGLLNRLISDDAIIGDFIAPEGDAGDLIRISGAIYRLYGPTAA